jgi:hypothetical protein
MYSFELGITDPISTLVQNLLQEESRIEGTDETKKWNKNFQYRIISTNVIFIFTKGSN